MLSSSSIICFSIFHPSKIFTCVRKKITVIEMLNSGLEVWYDFLFSRNTKKMAGVV